MTLDGKPIEGNIQFFPVDGKGQSAGGAFRDGHYEIQSSPGVMRVAINSPKVVGKRKAYDTPESPTIDIVEETLPLRYSDLKASELKTTVELGKKNKADFELKSGGAMPATTGM